MKASATPFDKPLARAHDVAGRTPPWAWRLAATAAGMAAAALVGKAARAGQGRIRTNSRRVGWAAALVGAAGSAALAGVAASIGRNVAQGAVNRAWRRRADLPRT